MPAALLSHLLYGNRESVDRQKRINSILPMLFAFEAQMNKQYVFISLKLSLHSSNISNWKLEKKKFDQFKESKSFSFTFFLIDFHNNTHLTPFYLIKGMYCKIDFYYF